MPADFTDESDSAETEEEYKHNVFGVRLYLFGPIAEASSAAEERETQVHSPQDKKLETPPHQIE